MIFKQTFETRINNHKNIAARNLLGVMSRKKTNLSIAADVSTCKELLDIADIMGPYICLLKTHVDILSDFSHDLITQLIDLSKKHDFLIFEGILFLI